MLSKQDEPVYLAEIKRESCNIGFGMKQELPGQGPGVTAPANEGLFSD